MFVVEEKNQSFWAYLQLMRPANIITAWADILTGCAVAGVFSPNIAWLLLATTGLYGGGVVFNDVFDADLDSIERPERPIPSGRASRSQAIVLGISLLTTGIVAASQVSLLSVTIAIFIALSALIYDAFAKHHTVLGPINMGCCRAANLSLGMSILPAILMSRWFLLFFPLLYIGAITLISQGEVKGGNSKTGILACLAIITVLISLLVLGFLPDYQVLSVLPLAILFSIRVLPPFIQATFNPTPELIQTAVKIGVLSLIVLNSAIASGFAGINYGLLVLALLPISLSLGKIFAVT